MEQHVLAWIAQYSYFAIFILLVFGIVGLPVPDETLLTFTGFLIYKDHLSFPLAFGSAMSGTTCGITISYWLGRTFGMKLIHRYGKYLRIKEEHVEKAHAFFRRAGHWSLTFGYFVPGVRHFTAFAAGMSGLESPTFALFAYSGGALWVTGFLSLGYFLGERWSAVQKEVDHYIVWLSIAAAAIIVLYLVWRKLRRNRK